MAQLIVIATCLFILGHAKENEKTDSGVEIISVNDGAYTYLANRSHLYTTDYNYTCFNASERVVVTYEDAPGKLVKLPTLKVITGGWESQTASNVIAYILMNEKMGIPMSWWPSSNPANYWPVDVTYPNTYAYWYASGLLDINFEVWASYLVDAQPATRNMLFNGSTSSAPLGVFGAQGLYIPGYLVDEFPYATHYISLNETDIRERFMNDTASYFKYLRDTEGNDSFDTWTWEDTRDLTGLVNPIMWSPSGTWVMPGLLKEMLDHHGLRFNQIHAGNEARQMKIIQDLYAHEWAFATYAYTPNLLFSQMDLRRVHFPDNPSGTGEDPCRIEDSCAIPDDSIFKLWSSRINEEIPEASQFMRTLQVNRVQVSEILEIRAEVLNNDATMSQTESYFNATCQWLLDNREVWTDAIVEIRRKQSKNTSDNTLVIILGSALSLVSLLIIIFFAYRIYKICKAIQSSYDDGMSLSDEYKRKLMLANATEFGMIFSTLFDFATDIITVFNIVFLWQDDYVEWFVITYAVTGVIAIIVASVDMAIRLANIQETSLEIKNGVDLNDNILREFLTEDVRTQIVEISRSSKKKDGDTIDSKTDNEEVKKDEVEGEKEGEGEENEKKERDVDEVQLKLGDTENDENTGLIGGEKGETMTDLLQKRTYTARWLRGDTIAIFVGIAEEFPFFILNIYSILALKIWSRLVFFSTLSTAMTIGYKLYALSNFFTLLSEKRVIEKQLKEAACSMITAPPTPNRSTVPLVQNEQ